MSGTASPCQGYFPVFCRPAAGRWPIRPLSLAAVIAVLNFPAVAQAHVGTLRGQDWWSAWNHDPLLLTSLALTAWLYGRGLHRIWCRAGHGRAVSNRQAAAFWCGLVALIVALVSPLDAWSEELSSAHMVQHLILMMVAAPLLVLGLPSSVLMWVLPLSWRQAVGRAASRLEVWLAVPYLLWQPLLLWITYAVVLWIWHLPVLYQLALRNRWVHDAQHLTFLIVSCLFWRLLFDPLSRLRLSRGIAVLYLFTTSLHASALGVYMALSPHPWYPAYADTTGAWNLTLLEDQQLAGAIMWMPGCAIYAIAAAILFAIWLQEFPEATSREQQPWHEQ